MKHWPTAPFAEVVDILDSRRVPVNSTERSKRQGSIPYYGATGQTGVIDDFLFDEELVLLGEDAAPFLESGKAKAYLIRGKSWVNNHAHVLRGKPGLLNAFLLYQLNNLDYRPYVSGTTRLKLPQGPMKQIPLLVPPIDDQHRIVAEIEKQFTRLEAGVAALRRVQANLKRYRAAVLKAACEGRLVPAEAELARAEGRPFESGQQLLARILTERRQNWQGRGKYKEPASLSASGYEPESLPEGWGRSSIAQVAFLDVGFAFKSAEFEKSGIRLLRGENLEPGRMRWADTRYWPESKLPDVEHLLIREGEIVLAMDRPLISSGLKIARARKHDLPCLLVQRMARLRPVVESMTPFLFMVMNTQGFIKHLLGGQTGTQLPHISGEGIQSFDFPLPPLAEQTRIVAEVERRLSVVEELEAVVTTNLQRATRLRQAVLQKAFTGELG